MKLEYFKIYDRLGNTIFSSADINKGWDGTYKGVEALEGTYVYTIKGNDFRGDVFLKGTVLLIR